MATEPSAVHDHFIFGDESSRTAHRYLVVGTMDCAREHVEEIITRLNVALRGHSEYAWSRNPSRDLNHFVEEIFFFIKRRQLWFRCMVVNMHHADHGKYSEGDKDLSLEKYIFQHLLGFARRKADLEKLSRFYVQLDNRTERYKGPAQKAALNHRFRNETGHNWEIFADVQDVDSKSQVMVQAADVLAGCVAWVWNRQYANEKVDPARVAFAELIAAQADLPLSPDAQLDGIKRRHFLNFGYPTLGFQETKGFTIWKMNFRLAEEREAKAAARKIYARYGSAATLGEVSKDYQIGAICFECTRSKPDILPNVAGRTLKDKYRPTCGRCHRKGYLLFRKRRPSRT
jgi:hypothetical protein